MKLMRSNTKRATTFRILTILLTLLLIATPTFPTSWRINPAPTPVVTTQSDLTFLTLNTFMLPKIAGRDEQGSCRNARLIEYLRQEQPDVVALQETFRGDILVLRDQLKDIYPYATIQQPATTSLLRVNGGVTVLSKYPIEDLHTEVFDSCGGQYHDCLAMKGVVHVRIKIHDKLKVEVFSMHMDAGTTESDRGYRAEQRRQLMAFRDRVVEGGWPEVMLGDFNVEGTIASDEYLDMLEDLRYPEDMTQDLVGEDRYTLNCEMTTLCEDKDALKQRLDYIFFYSGGYSARKLESRHDDLATDVCGGRYLSDHRAVLSRVRISAFDKVPHVLLPHGSAEEKGTP